MRRQDRAAERWRVGDLGQFQRCANGVGVDLQPQGRMGGAARHHDAPGREGGTEILHDQFGAEADALDDRAIDVGRRVLQRQTGDSAARQGIGVGRAVALEMVQDQ